jgi:hypothetical protein
MALRSLIDGECYLDPAVRIHLLVFQNRQPIPEDPAPKLDTLRSPKHVPNRVSERSCAAKSRRGCCKQVRDSN